MSAADAQVAPGLDATVANSDRAYAIKLIHSVCCLAGYASLIDDIHDDLRQDGVLAAIEQHDTAPLFDWLVSALSFQGIANSVASAYMQRHGQATWRDIDRKLRRNPICPKLKSYWHFYGCRYQKNSGTCAESEHFSACCLPSHPLRNGHLNQMAYSLFLFIRDIADGDLVGWIDARLAEADGPPVAGRTERMRDALIEPLRHVYGVSDKVLSMALSSILIAAGPERPRWRKVGQSMIAVDTLVHNFLHRTGILHRLDHVHPYGPACYGSGGCAQILHWVAENIDAREFNVTYPKAFPRFVQNAVWRYCAQTVFDVCNGNRIDDRQHCHNVYCRIHGHCDRVMLG